MYCGLRNSGYKRGNNHGLNQVNWMLVICLLCSKSVVMLLKGVKLADTIEEGEALGQNHKWYSFSSKMPVVSKPISMQDMSADSGIRT